MITIDTSLKSVMSMQKKLNRTEFVEELAIKLGVSKSQVEKFLNGYIDLVTEKLCAGFEVNITGFGLFRVAHRQSRVGINPKTGQKMNIPASKSVGFKVGKTLKEAVRK
jgi:DNA-binding protein HU-beta